MVNVYNVLSINTKRNDIGDLLFDTTDYIARASTERSMKSNRKRNRKSRSSIKPTRADHKINICTRTKYNITNLCTFNSSVEFHSRPIMWLN